MSSNGPKLNIKTGTELLNAMATAPKKKNGRYKPSREQQKAVIEFAVANNCVIHPLGMEYYVEGFNEAGHCVCDKNRPTCPCPEAPQEVKEKGHCLCQLFWRSYPDYIKEKRLEV